MSGQEIDNQPDFWVAFRPDACAGYARDANGNPTLVALLAYDPSASALREVKLTDLEPLRPDVVLAAFDQADAPTAAQLRERIAMGRGGGVLGSRRLAELGAIARSHRLTRELRAVGPAQDADAATAPDALSRRPGENPEQFYGRIQRAHEALARITDKPTTELARRAGVKVGTAAAWVSRANSMAKEGKL